MISTSKIEKLKIAYRYFSILFHLFVVGFIVYVHYVKNPDKKIDVRILKLLGLVSILMGLVFYFYGNDLVN